MKTSVKHTNISDSLGGTGIWRVATYKNRFSAKLGSRKTSEPSAGGAGQGWGRGGNKARVSPEAVRGPAPTGLNFAPSLASRCSDALVGGQSPQGPRDAVAARGPGGRLQPPTHFAGVSPSRLSSP